MRKNDEPARPGDPGVEALVDDLRGQGPATPGQFTLDRRKAREALRERLLANPYRYVLFLVRAAVRQGATAIEAQVTRRSVTLSFDGRGFDLADLERLYEAPFDRAVDLESPGLRELALGVCAASGAFQDVTVESVPARGAGARLALTVAGDERITPVGGAVGTRIRITGRVGRYAWTPEPGARRPEARYLRRRCPFSPVPVRLNGQELTEPLAGRPGAVSVSALRGDGAQGEAGFLPLESDRGVVRFLQDGVVVTEEVLPETDCGYVALVDAADLRLDAAEAAVVRDAAYDRVRTAVEADFAGRRTESVARECAARIERALPEQLGALGRSFRRAAVPFYAGVILAAWVLSTLGSWFFVHLPDPVDRLLGAMVVALILPGAGVAIVLGMVCYGPFRTGPFRRRFESRFPPASPLRKVMTLEDLRRAGLLAVVPSLESTDPANR
jgi:hypothetical protein